ncbi:major capsid protein [Gallaecimonas kandeliae]|uniref:major capsid protein n=1 Tax=Gallaecimonas kandeliae TaxID=3029055 RepID=UPI002648CC2A|nr:major capsid protein [Gallaecimonas kandeliae]WKE65068.1 major capsid protein [Gallaecimonas kandeliae]
MPQMNNNQVRVIDPILTTHANGYRQNKHVGLALFPRVSVAVSGGQILTFGKEAFMEYNIRRTPGSATKRVQFGYQGEPFALVQDALEGVVPREHLRDASQVPGINLGQRAINNAMAIASLALEREQGALARNAANYDSDHKVDLSAAKWTDDANDPAKDLRTGATAIRDTTGMEANTLIVSAKGFAALQENAKMKENFKYTSKDSITTAMIAALLDLENVQVGKAITSDASGNLSPVWGSDAVLAYVPTSPDPNREEPSYGYTYTMEGHPMVEQAYYDKNAKSWIYPVTYERVPVLSGMTAGYLLQNLA